jgi:hypothetical protein
MGRHAAVDGAGTDPIVAAALARRATAEGADDPAGGGEGGLGWPGDTTTGGGLGWPGSLDTADDADDADDDTADDADDTVDADDDTADDAEDDTADHTARIDVVPAVPGVPPTERSDDDEPAPPAARGWRRIFGGTAA